MLGLVGLRRSLVSRVTEMVREVTHWNPEGEGIDFVWSFDLIAATSRRLRTHQFEIPACRFLCG